VVDGQVFQAVLAVVLLRQLAQLLLVGLEPQAKDAMVVVHSLQAPRMVLLVVVVLVELVLVVVTKLHLLARLVEPVVLVHSTI
jgi:hypothetical protein